MIAHLLSLQESEPEYYSDTMIKVIILVLILAGTETSAVTSEWAVSVLLNHPEKLQKARAEIDTIWLFGNISPYLQNIMSETFWLFPALPLLLTHKASADCTIGSCVSLAALAGSDKQDHHFLYTLLSFSLLVLVLKYSTQINRKLPPSPLALPVLGHLHLLKQPVHRTFQKLSEKLGHIFSLRAGTRLIVVVSSPSLVEECFTKNDIVLANRPHFVLGQYIGYNFTNLVSASYGDHWRNLRRLSSIEVFSSARINMFLSTRLDEMRLQLEKLYKQSQHDFVKVQLRPVFTDLSFNVIMRMVAGKRFFGEGEDNKEAKVFQELIAEVLKAADIANPGDFFPVFRWIDYKGYEKNLADISERMDLFLQNLVDEKKIVKGSNTMIDHLLALQESEPQYYSDTMIKGIIIVLILAGTDTSAVTSEWAMSALLNHPEKLQKARAEIDSLVGNDSLINESDLSNLPYLQNIISETFRLFPAVPLLLAHEASSDCTIGEYHMPKGAMLLVNAWAMHRDPSIWDDPTSFKPERFEAGGVSPPKLMPFGMGRRSCPGYGLAQKVIGLALASLIQCFEWQRVDEGELDLMEGNGLTLPKAIPLEAKCKARIALQRTA